MVNKEYLGGVCRSREKLLYTTQKLEKLLSLSYEDAISTLLSEGYGRDNGREIDDIIKGEQKYLIDFIKEYSPSLNYTKLVLIKNDYYNANMCVRNVFLNVNLEKVSVLEGVYSIESIIAFIKTGVGELSSVLKATIINAKNLIESGKFSGVTLDNIFVKGMFEEVLLLTAKNKAFKEMAIKQIDAINISTAIRCKDENYLKDAFITGGNLELSVVLGLITNKPSESLLKGEYGEYISAILSAVKNNQPFYEFENLKDSFALKTLIKNKYVASGEELFYLYVNYKQNEIKNVRLILVSLSAGIEKSEVKKRLRVNYEG